MHCSAAGSDSVGLTVGPRDENGSEGPRRKFCSANADEGGWAVRVVRGTAGCCWGMAALSPQRQGMVVNPERGVQKPMPSKHSPPFRGGLVVGVGSQGWGFGLGCGFCFLLTALVVVSSPPPFPLPPLVLLFPPPPHAGVVRGYRIRRPRTAPARVCLWPAPGLNLALGPCRPVCPSRICFHP